MRYSALCFLSLLTLSGIVHSAPRPEMAAQAQNLTSRVPVYFEPNVGQFDPQVRFLARGAKYRAWITDREMVLVFSRRLPEKTDDLNGMRLPNLPMVPPKIESDVVRIQFGLLGGSGTDRATGIAVDSTGCVYIAGSTDSVNFPVVNALQSILNRSLDSIIAKLSPSGSQLSYSTYFGGNGGDLANDIAVDFGGNAFVVGHYCPANAPTIGRNP